MASAIKPKFLVLLLVCIVVNSAGAREGEAPLTSNVSVNTAITAVTAAELDISAVRVQKSVTWGPKLFSQTSLEQRKENLIVELCREVGADVLVDPQFTYSKRFLGSGRLTVSGYPAKYRSFRSMSEDEVKAFITTPDFKEGRVVFINK